MMAQRIRSKYSGILEINYVDGQKVLDSKNTSYSYGNLQKVWELTLDQISLRGVERILILGMGGGSSIELLREQFKYKGKIVAIEIDPVIIEIAKAEFNIRSNADLAILCMDAAEYVNKKTRKFDLILVDIFIDDKIPGKFLSREFWKKLSRKTTPGGRILFNAFTDVEKIKNVVEELELSGHIVQSMKKINGANLIINAVRKSS
ncbi:MAG: fused MFS/spermidine synthase [Bacteroidetes bacterium]|nr:fused MFS/spermidine synthase [Bacteroidota bacterium]